MNLEHDDGREGCSFLNGFFFIIRGLSFGLESSSGSKSSALVPPNSSLSSSVSPVAMLILIASSGSLYDIASWQMEGNPLIACDELWRMPSGLEAFVSLSISCSHLAQVVICDRIASSSNRVLLAIPWGIYPRLEAQLCTCQHGNDTASHLGTYDGIMDTATTPPRLDVVVTRMALYIFTCWI